MSCMYPRTFCLLSLPGCDEGLAPLHELGRVLVLIPGNLHNTLDGARSLVEGLIVCLFVCLFCFHIYRFWLMFLRVCFLCDTLPGEILRTDFCSEYIPSKPVSRR